MTNIRVLIADSNWKLMGRYEMFLEGCGMEVATADSALQCVELLRDFEPDVLVMEDELPWGQALGVLELMQTEPDLPVCPVILLSARPETEGLHQVDAIDVTEYHQPLSPVALREAIMSVYQESASSWQTALSIHG